MPAIPVLPKFIPFVMNNYSNGSGYHGVHSAQLACAMVGTTDEWKAEKCFAE